LKIFKKKKKEKKKKKIKEEGRTRQATSLIFELSAQSIGIIEEFGVFACQVLETRRHLT